MLLRRLVQATVLLTFIGADSAGAQLLLRVPADSPGLPAYARLERPFVHHTDEWAAIVFYRDPACVPADFNLLDFFDVPRAFGCGLTVSGFEIWENGPEVDAAPRHTISSGRAVPVWFVAWPVLEAAMADDVLTMPELESLNPLKGIADTYHELLHPSGGPEGSVGVVKVPHMTITASGSLPDGRSFQFQFNDVEKKDRLTNVRIVFR